MGSQCLGRGCNRTVDAHTGRLQPGNRVFDPKLFDALPSLKLAAVLKAGQLKIPPANILGNKLSHKAEPTHLPSFTRSRSSVQIKRRSG